jgi:general secretion pathway protein I
VSRARAALRAAGSRRRRAAAGFTLLEVLVAVAILALAMAAIISAGTEAAANAGALREKTLALWVAHNRLTEIELQPNWPDVGDSNDDVDMGGIRWRWKVHVKATQDDNLRRVDVDVVKSAQPDSKAAYASLTGFIAKTGRTTTP